MGGPGSGRKKGSGGKSKSSKKGILNAANPREAQKRMASKSMKKARGRNTYSGGGNVKGTWTTK